METQNQLYGRLTTLNKLKERRDDAQRHPYRRMQADRAIKKIVAQLRDRKLMKLRERLIRATLYGDLHLVWQLENQIRIHEGDLQNMDHYEYTQRDEDEA